MKTWLMNSQQSPEQSVRKFASPSAHNQQESPFGVWSVREKKTTIESDTLTASARLICVSRMIRTGTADGPRPVNSDGLHCYLGLSKS